jgi:subtilisin family serine protease
MGKKIVIPNLIKPGPQKSANAAFTKSLRSTTEIGRGRTHAEVLQGRREHLHQFAADALSASAQGKKRRPRAASLKSKAQYSRSEPSGTPVNYHVLEGLGILLVDEDMFDEDMMRSQMDAVVLDNVQIASVTPVAASSTGEPDFWSQDKINVSSLRSQGLNGEGITVGVLDSGIYATHQEFAGKQIVFAQFDQQGQRIDSPAKDFGKHGTHVSGLIAGKNAGVAPAATLVVAAVLTSNGGTAGYLAQILAGLNWLLTEDFSGDPETPGVHLVNASLEAGRGYKDFLYNALTNALAAPGTLMIGAVGNSGSAGVNNCSSPGNYDIVVGVGATDIDDNIASFSSWGTIAESSNVAKPDMCAPGKAVWSSVPGSGNHYQQMDGTSMASPIVAGAAALMMQQDPTLAHNPLVLKDEIIKRTIPLEDVARGGRGRLQL